MKIFVLLLTAVGAFAQLTATPTNRPATNAVRLAPIEIEKRRVDAALQAGYDELRRINEYDLKLRQIHGAKWALGQRNIPEAAQIEKNRALVADREARLKKLEIRKLQIEAMQIKAGGPLKP